MKWIRRTDRCGAYSRMQGFRASEGSSHFSGKAGPAYASIPRPRLAVLSPKRTGGRAQVYLERGAPSEPALGTDWEKAVDDRHIFANPASIPEIHFC